MEQPTGEQLLDLYRLVDRLSATAGLQPALDEVLAASIELLGADMGHIRLLEGRDGVYSFASQKGFPQEYLDYFSKLSPEVIAEGPAIQSLQSGSIVTVENVATHPPFAAHLEIIGIAGYVSMLSKPLFDRSQRIIGSFSAHFREPGLPSPEKLQVLDLYMRLAADAIEQARRGEELRDSEARYRALTELSPEAILVNQDFRWVYANEAAAEVFGAKSPEDLIGRNPLDFMHSDYHEVARQRVSRALAGGGLNPLLEQRWYRLDGSIFDCEVASAPITWQGRPAIQLICRDVTERKQAEEAMKSASRLKDEFLGLVSHELRTPLTTIRGYASLLARRKDLPDDIVDEGLHDLLAESEHLNRIVENMLVLTRLQIGQTVPVEPVMVIKVVEAAIKRLQEEQTRADISLGEFPESAVVRAVPAYAEQILQNLLSNAYKYSPPEAPIEVFGEVQDDVLRISVADRGRGVADPDKVFTAFVREPGADMVAPGLGIGLTVCKRLVEAMGGEIRAWAREGGGSVFSFTLPLESA